MLLINGFRKYREKEKKREYLAHGRDENCARPEVRPGAMEEERHRAAHRLAQQEPAAAAATGAGGLGDEEGGAVSDEGLEVGNVSL
jgi:hypothetical protein